MTAGDGERALFDKELGQPGGRGTVEGRRVKLV